MHKIGQLHGSPHIDRKDINPYHIIQILNSFYRPIHKFRSFCAFLYSKIAKSQLLNYIKLENKDTQSLLTNILHSHR